MGSASYTVTCVGCGRWVVVGRATSQEDARRLACERHGWELETRKDSAGRYAALDRCPTCVSDRARLPGDVLPNLRERPHAGQPAPPPITDHARFANACTCGDTMTGWVEPARSADGVLRAWASIHSGPGHAPATLAEAANARRRGERRRQREAREALDG